MAAHEIVAGVGHEFVAGSRARDGHLLDVGHAPDRAWTVLETDRLDRGAGGRVCRKVVDHDRAVGSTRHVQHQGVAAHFAFHAHIAGRNTRLEEDRVGVAHVSAAFDEVIAPVAACKHVGVTARAAGQYVIVRAAIKGVRARAAVLPVHAAAADEPVVAKLPAHHVAASAAIQRVVAVPPHQRVGAAQTGEHIVRVIALDVVFAIRARQRHLQHVLHAPGRGQVVLETKLLDLRSVGALAAKEVDHHGPVIAALDVEQHVGRVRIARHAHVGRLDAAAKDHGVHIAGRAVAVDEVIATVASPEQIEIVARIAVEVVVPGIAVQDIVARPAHQVVIARAALECVLACISIKHVVGTFAKHDVVAVADMRRIARGRADHDVRAGAAGLRLSALDVQRRQAVFGALCGGGQRRVQPRFHAASHAGLGPHLCQELAGQAIQVRRITQTVHRGALVRGVDRGQHLARIKANPTLVDHQRDLVQVRLQARLHRQRVVHTVGQGRPGLVQKAAALFACIHPVDRDIHRHLPIRVRLCVPARLPMHAGAGLHQLLHDGVTVEALERRDLVVGAGVVVRILRDGLRRAVVARLGMARACERIGLPAGGTPGKHHVGQHRLLRLARGARSKGLHLGQ